MQLVSADAEHVEMLRRGPRSWNAWREQNPTTLPNLTGLRLSASERQMGVMNGGPINLASARMRRAYLRFATLSGANLAGANLLEARNLTQIQLDDAMGDAMTELPPHLTRPGFWLEDDLDPALEVADGVDIPSLPKGRSKSGTMSWLVGGAPVGSAKG